MPQVRFNLHAHSGGTIIRLVFRFDGNKFVYYPGFKISASDWNSSKQELRKGAPLWQEVNAALRRLKNEVERIYTESLGSGDTLRPQILKIRLDEFWKGTKVVVRNSSVAAFTRTLAETRLAGGQIQENTAKALQTLASQIERFNPNVTFDEVTIEFYNAFTAFMLSEDKSHNTVASRVKRLKGVMSAAFDMGLTTNQAFRSSRFLTKEVEVDNIYLTESEIEAIERLDLSSMPGMQRVRDSFLLGAYTGLRYSDFSTLKPGDYHTHDGIFMVRLRAKKTQRVIAVPVNERALKILKSYDMQPPNIANQVMNRYLKEVAKLAGISEMVKVETTKGGIRKTSMLPKWSRVTTHTARRSFSTISYIRLASAGLPIDGIMEITGHKTRREFLNYIKVGAEERAALWAKAGG